MHETMPPPSDKNRTPRRRARQRCPECGASIRVKTLNEGGGVECSARCGWWFCY